MFLKIVHEDETNDLMEGERVIVLTSEERESTIFRVEDWHETKSSIEISVEDPAAVYILNDRGDTIEQWHVDRRRKVLRSLLERKHKTLVPPDRPPYSPAKSNPLIDPLAAVERAKAKATPS